MRCVVMALCMLGAISASGCAQSEEARLRIYVDGVEWEYDGPRDGNSEIFFRDGASLVLSVAAVRDIHVIDGSRTMLTSVVLREPSAGAHLPISGMLSARRVFTPEPGHDEAVEWAQLVYDCAFCLSGPEANGDSRDERLSGYIDLEMVTEDVMSGWVDITADPLSQYTGAEPHVGRMVGAFHARHHAPSDR